MSTQGDSRYPVEIGVSVPEDFRAHDELERALGVVREALRSSQPRFDWRLVQTRASASSRSTMALLDVTLDALRRHKLDLCLCVTEAPLRNRNGHVIAGAASSLLNVGALSMFDLQEFQSGRLGLSLAVDAQGAPSEPEERLVQALSLRILHLLAALLGVARDEHASIQEWRARGRYLSEDGQDEFHHQLLAVGDQRLEETAARRLSSVRFGLRALWVARSELLRAVVRGRPWLFPLRSSKLMAATASAGIVVLLTAESWELGSAMPWLDLLLVTAAVWIFTVVFLLTREGILVEKLPVNTEQRVVARAATTFGIGLGMLLTFGFVAAAGALVGSFVYPEQVISTWIGRSSDASAIVKVSTFVATLGIGVGALGASLDTPAEFKYAVVVSDELPTRRDA